MAKGLKGLACLRVLGTLRLYIGIDEHMPSDSSYLEEKDGLGEIGGGLVGEERVDVLLKKGLWENGLLG